MSGGGKIRRKRKRTSSDDEDYTYSNVSFDDESYHQKRLRLARSYLDRLKTMNPSDSSTCWSTFACHEVTKPFLIKFHEDNHAPISLSVSCEGFIFSANKRGALSKWSMETRRKVAALPFVKRGIINCVATSPDYRFVAVSDYSGSIQIWAPDIIKRIDVLKGHKDIVTCLKFREDSRVLYSGGIDNVANIWNMRKMCLVKTLRGHTAPIMSIDALFPDLLLTGSCDNQLIVWKINDKTIFIYKEHTSAVLAVKFVNENYFISGDGSGKLIAWSVCHRESLCSLELAHGIDTQTNRGNAIYSITYIQDEDLIASGSNNAYIMLWSFNFGQRTISCAHKIHMVGFVNALVVTRCGSCLVGAIGTESVYGRGRYKNRNGARNCLFVMPVSKLK